MSENSKGRAPVENRDSRGEKTMSEFVPFPKIARFNREVIVTEKIDGTNAQVFIRQLGPDEAMPTETPIVVGGSSRGTAHPSGRGFEQTSKNTVGLGPTLISS